MTNSFWKGKVDIEIRRIQENIDELKISPSKNPSCLNLEENLHHLKLAEHLHHLKDIHKESIFELGHYLDAQDTTASTSAGGYRPIYNHR